MAAPKRSLALASDYCCFSEHFSDIVKCSEVKLPWPYVLRDAAGCWLGPRGNQIILKYAAEFIVCSLVHRKSPSKFVTRKFRVALAVSSQDSHETHVAISPNHRFLARGFYGKTIKIHDLQMSDEVSPECLDCINCFEEDKILSGGMFFLCSGSLVVVTSSILTVFRYLSNAWVPSSKIEIQVNRFLLSPKSNSVLLIARGERNMEKICLHRLTSNLSGGIEFTSLQLPVALRCLGDGFFCRNLFFCQIYGNDACVWIDNPNMRMLVYECGPSLKNSRGYTFPLQFEEDAFLITSHDNLIALYYWEKCVCVLYDIKDETKHPVFILSSKAIDIEDDCIDHMKLQLSIGNKEDDDFANDFRFLPCNRTIQAGNWTYDFFSSTYFFKRQKVNPEPTTTLFEWYISADKLFDSLLRSCEPSFFGTVLRRKMAPALSTNHDLMFSNDEQMKVYLMNKLIWLYGDEKTPMAVVRQMLDQVNATYRDALRKRLWLAPEVESTNVNPGNDCLQLSGSNSSRTLDGVLIIFQWEILLYLLIPQFRLLCSPVISLTLICEYINSMREACVPRRLPVWTLCALLLHASGREKHLWQMYQYHVLEDYPQVYKRILPSSRMHLGSQVFFDLCNRTDNFLGLLKLYLRRRNVLATMRMIKRRHRTSKRLPKTVAKIIFESVLKHIKLDLIDLLSAPEKEDYAVGMLYSVYAFFSFACPNQLERRNFAPHNSERTWISTDKEGVASSLAHEDVYPPNLLRNRKNVETFKDLFGYIS